MGFSPFFTAARAETPVIVLHTHDEEISDETLRENPAVETIRCILGRAGRRVDIRRAPRLRNRGLLAAGKIDGIFPNVLESDLDAIAAPTEPFVLERWSYVQRRDSRNPARPRGHTVGVVLGSNESRFLKDEGTVLFDAIPNMESLVKLLASRRIPYGMADDWSFDAEAEMLGYDLRTFQSAIARYVPLQAYFSKTFVDANPELIAAFNENIRHCVHEGQRVALWEREILRNEVDRILDGSQGVIVGQLKQYRTVSALDPLLSRIESLARADADWRRALTEDRMNVLMETILSNPLSDLLREIAGKNPDITEIFVVNADGYIVGMNRLTTDYWQGDEAAAGAILGGGADRHYSPFEYDLSTRRFQVQVSQPVFDPAGQGTPVGMITVGVDAAAVLAGKMH